MLPSGGHTSEIWICFWVHTKLSHTRSFFTDNFLYTSYLLEDFLFLSQPYFYPLTLCVPCALTLTVLMGVL